MLGFVEMKNNDFALIDIPRTKNFTVSLNHQQHNENHRDFSFLCQLEQKEDIFKFLKNLNVVDYSPNN